MVNYCYRVDDKCMRITPNIFVVKNQNGFNKALYEFKKPDEGGKYGDGNNYSKEELRKMVDNYPEQYPCVINLNFIWEISVIMNLKKKRGLCPNCKTEVIVKEIMNERCPCCGTYLPSRRILFSK